MTLEGRPCLKKMNYVNPWSNTRSYRLRSSQNGVMTPRGVTLTLAGHAIGKIRLAFSGKSSAQDQLVLFINDQTSDQNEECVLIRVT